MSGRRRQGGKIAANRGALAEAAVRASLDLLVAQGKGAYYWTYPKSRIIKNAAGEKVVIYTGGGVPDVSAVINIANTTRPVWFDVKTTSRKNSVTLPSKAYRQALTMQSLIRVGGVGGFLVLWRSPAVDEWRFHSEIDRSASVNPITEKVSLVREFGRLVPPIDEGVIPTVSDNPWDNQVPLPDIEYIIRQVYGTIIP